MQGPAQRLTMPLPTLGPAVQRHLHQLGQKAGTPGSQVNLCYWSPGTGPVPLGELTSIRQCHQLTPSWFLFLCLVMCLSLVQWDHWDDCHQTAQWQLCGLTAAGSIVTSCHVVLKFLSSSPLLQLRLQCWLLRPALRLLPVTWAVSLCCGQASVLCPVAY